jgi:predicted small lipoprotein YifL|tara:strand:- start:13242 stop:13415 length:174 start_codon:yes stop_codon:yes gene_type:complete
MRITTLIIVLFLLQACGQKGALYLPQDEDPGVSSKVQEGSDAQITDNSNQPITQQEK